MERKSIALTLTSLVSVIFFGYSFLFFIFFYPSKYSPWFIMLRYNLCLIVSLAGLIASVFVFDIRRWARKIILYSCLFFLGLAVVSDASLFIMCHWFGVKCLFSLVLVVFDPKKIGLYSFWLILIIYLTRPRVKQQFK